MLSQLDASIKSSYGFRFEKLPDISKIATIHAIGVEHRFQAKGSTYYWDCNMRADKKTYIFQYTLSGQGEININGQVHALTKGKAFIVSVPESCEYYLPPTSDDWKFIYITLEGSAAHDCWQHVKENHGYVFDIDQDAPIISRLVTIFNQVKEGLTTNPFHISSKAFEFITFCYRHFENVTLHAGDNISPQVKSAILFIKKYFNTPLSVEEIAAHADLSKSYLNKRFKDEIGMPPLHFLNHYRIEKAAYHLQHTSKPVKEISEDLGFADPNYFCKVFRRITGMATSDFRKNLGVNTDFDFLITDKHGLMDLE